MTIKIFECAICKNLYERGVKKEERVFGSRKEIREHLVDVHNKKGRKNRANLKDKDFGKSEITESCILFREY